jgi:hypothetical protein
LEDLLGREPFYPPFVPSCLADLRHAAFRDPSTDGCDQFFDARGPPIPYRVDVPTPTNVATASSLWSPLTTPAYNPSFHPPAYIPAAGGGTPIGAGGGTPVASAHITVQDQPPPTDDEPPTVSTNSREGDSYQESAWQS